MANQGTAASKSAHFAAYANAYRSGGPWQYTVPIRAMPTSDFFNVGCRLRQRRVRPDA